MDHRPNVLLQPDERCHKLHLKRLLKEQHLLYKYSMRHQQAIRRRNDEAVIQASFLKLLAYQETVSNPRVLRDPFIQRICTADSTHPEMLKARKFIERFYGQLQSNVISSSSSLATNERKEHRLQVARTLLRHMTKGTQELRQFDDLEALLGYTRHKFIERALLVVSSLNYLCFEYPLIVVSDDADIHSSTGVSPATVTAFVQRLRRVRNVTCIGCGPGGDAVGGAAWFQVMRHMILHTENGEDADEWERDNGQVLEGIQLFDWAMDQWHPIVSSVKDLLTFHYHLVHRVQLDSCDVRHSLSDQRKNSKIENWTDSSDLLVVVSYLFSETRNAWYPFFDEYVEQCPTGTLFLLTDPTAWQLHIFRQRYEYGRGCTCHENHGRCVQFMWLDSSMYRPELQELEGRNGPAVLLAMKIDNPMRNNCSTCCSDKAQD
jgi:hypothetical protein